MYKWEVSSTHMGLVQDMVTGLLKGSSSMMPLFLKSRGVGFAVNQDKKSALLFEGLVHTEIKILVLKLSVILNPYCLTLLNSKSVLFTKISKSYLHVG